MWRALLLAIALASFSAHNKAEAIDFGEATVRRELESQFGCSAPLKESSGKSRPARSLDCERCLESVRARITHERGQVFTDIDTAFGEWGVGKIASDAIFAAGLETEASYTQDASSADHLFLVHSWAQASATLMDYAEKALAARAKGGNFLSAIRSAFQDEAFDGHQQPSAFAAIPKALKENCKQDLAADKYDCYTAALTQLKAQATFATKKLATASSKLLWSYRATRICGNHSDWDEMRRALKNLADKNPKARGADLFAPRPHNTEGASPSSAASAPQKTLERLRSRKKDKSIEEHPCIVKFRNEKNRGALAGILSPSAVCEMTRDTELIGFTADFQNIFADVGGADYFTALRMQAISEFMEAHLELLESYPDDASLVGCKDFSRGIAELRRAPLSKRLKKRLNLKKDRGFLENVTKLAQQIQREAERAENIEREIQLRQMRTTRGHADQVIDRLKEELRFLSEEIASRLRAAPYLQAGHPEGSPIYRDLPLLEGFASLDAKAADFPEKIELLFLKARPLVRDNIVESIKRFCKPPDEGGLTWDQLIQREDLTSKVLARMPVFKVMHQCSIESLDSRRWGKLIGIGAIGLGCIPATAIATATTSPAGGALVGGACVAFISGEAFSNYVQAQNEKEWIARCVAAGGEVCNGKDLIKADENLSNAIGEAVLTAGALGLSGGGALLKVLKIPQLTGGLSRLSEIQSFTRKVKQAKSIEDFERLANHVADLRLHYLEARLATTNVDAEVTAIRREIVELETNNEAIKKTGRSLKVSVEADAESALGKVLSKEEKKALRKAAETRKGPAFGAEDMEAQNEVLREAKFTQDEITRLRELEIIPSHAPQIANPKPMKIDLVSFKSQEKWNPKWFEDMRIGKEINYFVDDSGATHFSEQAMNFSGNDIKLVKLETSAATNASPVLMREAGVMRYDPGSKSFRMYSKYSLGTSEEESAMLAKKLRKRLGIENLSREPVTTGIPKSNILSCLDVVAKQTTGSSFVKNLLISSNLVVVGAIVTGELAGKGRLSTKQGQLVALGDWLGSNASNIGYSLLSWQLLASGTSDAKSLLARIAYGLTMNAAQNEGRKGLLGVDKEVSDQMLAFDQKHFLVKLPWSLALDKFVWEKLPLLVGNACVANPGVRFIVSKVDTGIGIATIRIVEKFATTILYLDVRKAVTGR